MSTKMVQIRDVPSDVVDALKSRAAAEGTSLSEFLRAEIEEIARRPTLDDVLDRLSRLPRRDLTIGGADLVRSVRNEF
jgi:antitoxin FitA